MPLELIEEDNPHFKCRLRIVRRHTANCIDPATDNRTSEDCDCPVEGRKKKSDTEKCPIWVRGTITAKGKTTPVQETLDTRNLSNALSQIRERLKRLSLVQGDLTKCERIPVVAAADGYIRDRINNSIEGGAKLTLAEAIYRSDTFRKLNDLMSQLKRFAERNGIVFLDELDAEKLNAFRESWRGALNKAVLCHCECHRANSYTRRMKVPRRSCGECQCFECPKCHRSISNAEPLHPSRCDGTGEYLPKTLVGKQKYQDSLRAFFRYCITMEWITKNSAVQLSVVRVSRTKKRLPFQTADIHSILNVIEEVFPIMHKKVRAFFLVLCSTGLRLSDVVTLRSDSLFGERLLLEMEKTDDPLYTRLPPVAVEALHSFKATSRKFFFWTGNGKLDTAKADWSDVMLRLYRKVELEQRSHSWRDTLATSVLGSVDGSMETAQTLLGHRDIRITQKHYQHWDVRRQQMLDEALQQSWIRNGLVPKVKPQKLKVS